jgi:glycosyltransferase involved in cell wall biosynthesis
MIARREEPLIESTIKSIKDCSDEIIIVDTGLHKETRTSVERFMESNPDLNISVFDHPWDDDFSKARNFSLRKATKEWIFVIDADEFVQAAEVMKLLDIVEQNDEVAGFSFVQKTYTNNVEQFGFVPFKISVKKQGNVFSFAGYTFCNMVRLFRNDPMINYENPVHESVDNSIRATGGRIAKTDATLHHFKELKGVDWQDKTQLHYLEIYKKNMDRFTNKAKAYSDLGILYYAYVKDYPKAIGFLKTAMDEYTDRGQSPNPKTMISLGYAYFMSDDFTNAKDVFERFLSEHGEHQSADRARSALQMIDERLNGHKKEQAA